MKFTHLLKALPLLMVASVASADDQATSLLPSLKNEIQKNSPVNVLSHDPVFLQQLEMAQKNQIVNMPKPLANELTTPRIFKVDAPIAPSEIKNKTQLFIFKDLTHSVESPTNSSESPTGSYDSVDLHTREAQVEALKQAAARKYPQ